MYDASMCCEDLIPVEQMWQGPPRQQTAIQHMVPKALSAGWRCLMQPGQEPQPW